MTRKKSPTQSSNVSRRNFLTTLGIMAGGIVSYNALQACTPASPDENSNSDGGAGDKTASSTKTLKLSEDAYKTLATVGGMAAFDDGDQKILLIRSAEDTVVALDRICTHTSCDMKSKDDGGFGAFADGKLTCTCHNSVFGTDGKKISGPATRDLATYSVSFDKDKGEVTLTL